MRKRNLAKLEPRNKAFRETLPTTWLLPSSPPGDHAGQLRGAHRNCTTETTLKTRQIFFFFFSFYAK